MVDGDDEAAQSCYAVADCDDTVDAQCEAASETVVRELLGREESTEDLDLEAQLTDISRLLLTLCDLERIGNHAVNIGFKNYLLTILSWLGQNILVYDK